MGPGVPAPSSGCPSAFARSLDPLLGLGTPHPEKVVGVYKRWDQNLPCPGMPSSPGFPSPPHGQDSHYSHSLAPDVYNCCTTAGGGNEAPSGDVGRSSGGRCNLHCSSGAWFR